MKCKYSVSWRKKENKTKPKVSRIGTWETEWTHFQVGRACVSNRDGIAYWTCDSPSVQSKPHRHVKATPCRFKWAWTLHVLPMPDSPYKWQSRVPEQLALLLSSHSHFVVGSEPGLERRYLHWILRLLPFAVFFGDARYIPFSVYIVLIMNSNTGLEIIQF